MTNERIYPYVGRIIRPQIPDSNPYGANRATDGTRNVTVLHDNLPFMKMRMEGEGEQSFFRAGTGGATPARFQTPNYLNNLRVSDELQLKFGNTYEAWNITNISPQIGRPGLTGTTIGNYTVLLAERKTAQNTGDDVVT